MGPPYAIHLSGIREVPVNGLLITSSVHLFLMVEYQEHGQK